MPLSYAAGLPPESTAEPAGSTAAIHVSLFSDFKTSPTPVIVPRCDSCNKSVNAGFKNIQYLKSRCLPVNLGVGRVFQTASA